MIIKVQNETPFQVLSNSFTIGPSTTGYELQVGATSRDFTTLFTVAANTPRMVTNVANGSYFRLKNNSGEVEVNWSRTCKDEGGGSGSGSTVSVNQILSAGTQIASITVDNNTTMLYAPEGGSSDILEPVEEFPEDPQEGDVVAFAGREGYQYGITFEERTDLGQNQDKAGGRFTFPMGCTDDFLEGQLYYIGKVGLEGETLNDLNISSDGNGGTVLAYEDPWDPLLSVFMTTDGADTGESESSYMIFNYYNEDSNFVVEIYPTDLAEAPVVFEDTKTSIDMGVYQFDGTDWNKVGNGGGNSNVVELTQAEYDALVDKDPDTTYIISDAQSINMDDYASQADLTTLSGSVGNMGTAIAGKADKANVTPNTAERKFPLWNAEGVITGSNGGEVNQTTLSLNGSNINYLLRVNSSGNIGPIFAPTTTGTAGQPLLSNGSGAPVWGTYKFQFITQTEYDALVTPDSTTIYFIIGD